MDRCIRNPGIVAAVRAEQLAAEKKKKGWNDKMAQEEKDRDEVSTRDLIRMLETDASFRQMVAKEKGWDDPNRCFEFAAFIRTTLPDTGAQEFEKPSVTAPAARASVAATPSATPVTEKPVNPFAKTITKMTREMERNNGKR